MKLLLIFRQTVVNIIVVFLFVPVTTNASKESFSLRDEQTDENLRQIFSSIYNFRFDEAERLLMEAKKTPQSESWYYFASSNLDLWKIFAGDKDNELACSFKQNLSRLLTASDSLKSKHEQRFLRIMHYSYKTRLSMTNKEYVAAFKAISKYYDLLEPTFEQNGYMPFKLINGLYFYLIDYAGENYFLLRPFLRFYKSGDVTTGLNYLEASASCTNEILSTEATYFLMKIYFDLEDNPEKALPYAARLYKKYPGNFIFNLYYHKIKSKIRPKYIAETEKEKQRVMRVAQLNQAQKLYFNILLEIRYPA